MIKSHYVFLVTDVSQLKPVSDYILNYSYSAQHPPVLVDGILHWIAGYYNEFNPYRSLPAYIGFSNYSSAHVSLKDRSPKALFSMYYKGYTLLPFDYINHPEDYPELLI